MGWILLGSFRGGVLDRESRERGEFLIRFRIMYSEGMSYGQRVEF